MRRGRRAFVTGAAAATVALGLPRAGRTDTPRSGAPEDCEVRDISVEGDRALGRRFTLLVPKHLSPDQKVPLLVLLHGLGETGDERTGAFAWIERYGLGTAYDRLRRAPIHRGSRRGEWTDARLAEVNAALLARPFGGLAIACPVTPNVARARDPSAALDGFTRWLAEVVVPRARKEAPVHTDAARTHLGGCSLGGFVGLEVFLRRPDLFGAWSGVQSAFGAHRAASYAERIEAAFARAGRRPLLVETSTADPFREANEALASALAARGVARDLRVVPGPHDQPWLREAGTVEMLLWHDQRPR